MRHYRTDLIANSVEFLDRRGQDGGDGDWGGGRGGGRARGGGDWDGGGGGRARGSGVSDVDDLPFE